MSGKFASPLVLHIKPSRKLSLLLAFAHAGAAVCLFPTSLSIWQISVGLAIIFGSAMVWAFHLGYCKPDFVNVFALLKRFRSRIVELRWDENDQWHLVDENDRCYCPQLLPTTLVHPDIVVLNFRMPDEKWVGRRRSIVLVEDSVSEDDFRRLRVRLRWYSGFEQENSVEPG